VSTYWISTTRWGELQVEAEERGEGWYARLAEPHDRLSAVKGAVGTTLDEALDNLAHGLERFGADEPQPPRWPQTPQRGLAHLLSASQDRKGPDLRCCGGKAKGAEPTRAGPRGQDRHAGRGA
jgi:hypothetical protein